MDRKLPEREKLYNKLTSNSKSVNKTEIKLLNRKLLEEFKEYYGQYPFYGLYSDSSKERFKWLKNSFDGGALFFKTIKG